MRPAAILFLLVTLAACGGSAQDSNVPAMATVPPIPQRTDVIISSDGEVRPGAASATATEDTQKTPGVERIDCGDLSVSGSPARGADSATVRAASACFLKAVSVCQAATLTLRERNSHIVRQFMVESGAKCTLRQALQPDPNSAPAVVDCEDVRGQDGGLVFERCSHFGDLVLSPQ